MAYFAYMRSGKNRYLVIRWKKRINGIPTIVKKVSVGTADDLAKTIDGNLAEIKIAVYNGGTTLCILRIDHMIGLKAIVNGIVDHHDRGMLPGDYFLLFIMNRLSDTTSKDSIEKWIASGKKVNGRLDFKSETGRKMGMIMKLNRVLKQ